MNLLTLPVTEAGVAFGSMTLPIERSALAKASGNKVVVGVRPEDLDLSTTGEGLPVQVDVVEELGADAYIYGRTDAGEKVDIDDPDLRGEDKPETGDNIIARTDGRKPPTRGETVHLVPTQAGHVHFFDLASGARLTA